VNSRGEIVAGINDIPVEKGETWAVCCNTYGLLLVIARIVLMKNLLEMVATFRVFALPPGLRGGIVASM
jgi:hypothetical protein